MTSKKENIRWNVVHKLTPPITTKQTLNAKQLKYKKERKNGEVSNASKPSNMATSLLFAHSRALQANKLSIFPNFLAPFSIVSQLPPAVKFARKSQGWWKNLYESNLFFLYFEASYRASKFSEIKFNLHELNSYIFHSFKSCLNFLLCRWENLYESQFIHQKNN